jgi:hypothetical protein
MLFHRSTLQVFYTADKANVKLYIQNHTLCVTQERPICPNTWSLDASRQVGVHTGQVKGRLPAGGGGGKASCLKNRTSFYSLALPDYLPIYLPCLKIWTS